MARANHDAQLDAPPLGAVCRIYDHITPNWMRGPSPGIGDHSGRGAVEGWERRNFWPTHTACFFAKSAESIENNEDSSLASARKCKIAQKSAEEYQNKRVEWKRKRHDLINEGSKQETGLLGASFRPSRNLPDRTEDGRSRLSANKHGTV